MTNLDSNDRAALREEYATGKWTVEELADIWNVSPGLVQRLCAPGEPVKRSTSESRLNHPRRCHARRTDGEPCRRYAIRGGVVCRVHGGAAPQVVANAREVLALNALNALRNILGLADDADSEQVKLTANRDLLDRAGLGAKQSVGVEVSVQPWEEILSDAWDPKGGPQYPKYPGAPAPPALVNSDPVEVVDAEVVDDPEPHPDAAGERRTPAERGDGPPTRPAFAEEPVARPPGNELMTMEDAVAGQARYIRSQRIKKRR